MRTLLCKLTKRSAERQNKLSLGGGGGGALCNSGASAPAAGLPVNGYYAGEDGNGCPDERELPPGP